MRLPESRSNRHAVVIRILAWCGIAVALGLAMLVRYRLIEPATVAQACDAGLQSWQCTLRFLAIRCFDHQQLAYVALAGSVLALLTRSGWAAWLTAVVSATGLVWYCFEPSAVGLVIGVLLLAQAQMRDPHRQTEARA